MSCSSPRLELKIYHVALRASRPFLLTRACPSSPERLDKLKNNFGRFCSVAASTAEAHKSKGQNEEHLQAHWGAVHGAALRFLTTAKHKSLSQSSLGNGGHHSLTSQIPSSHQSSSISIGCLPSASFSPLDQTSKISQFGKHFIMEVLYQMDRDHMLGAWPHSFKEEMTQTRKSQPRECSRSLMDASLPHVYVQPYLLPGVSFVNRIKFLVKASSFPRVMAMAVLWQSYLLDIPRPGGNTLLSCGVCPPECLAAHCAFINPHSHTTATPIMYITCERLFLKTK